MAKGTIKVNEVLCKGCGLCIPACPKKIVKLDESKINATGYNPAMLFKPEDCIACASCARMCPEAAITVEKLD